MKNFADMTIEELLSGEHECPCGRKHSASLKKLLLGHGVAERTPEVLRELGASKVFVICDDNTYEAAGKRVLEMLEAAELPYVLENLGPGHIEPDEYSVGAVMLDFDPSCDFILSVGSGVINDISKVAAFTSGKPYVAFATAPSMDGYASNSSAMHRGGIKVTVYTTCPEAIIADTEIMSKAPMVMLQAGLGDIFAKYISICEWRISNIVTDEYYCGNIAGLMRESVAKCAAAAPKLASRDEEAVKNVAEGLILAGIAMSFAQVSRPASGVEHYFSHIWEMNASEFGSASSLHGIQVGVGTILALEIYEKLRKYTPDKEKALASFAAFDEKKWEASIREMFGRTADNILEIELQTGKNSPEKHKQRLDTIISRWDEITAVMDAELPERAATEALMRSTGAPTRPREIGISGREAGRALVASKEIRDKYVGSRLLCDLGLLEEYAADIERRES